MDRKNIIGNRIREIRQTRGMTQKDLAAALGLKSQNISDYERTRAMPSVEILNKLADFFEKPVDWFYGRTVKEAISSVMEESKTSEPRSDTIDQLELAVPNHETYPWGYFFRSNLILWMWDYALMHMNRRIDNVSDGSFHAFVIKNLKYSVGEVISANKEEIKIETREGKVMFKIPHSEMDDGTMILNDNISVLAKSLDVETQVKILWYEEDKDKFIHRILRDGDIILPFQPDVYLDIKTLYIFPSPYKHPIIIKFYSEIFTKLETKWQVSKKEDFYFGYRAKNSGYWVKTVEISFREQLYSPTYTFLGHDKARYIDFASIVYFKLPNNNGKNELLKSSSKKNERIILEDYDNICLFGGCHRLGTGAAAYAVSHPEFLRSLLSKKKISPEDSFELILKVETTTGEPLTTSSISLMDAVKIDIGKLTENLLHWTW